MNNFKYYVESNNVRVPYKTKRDAIAVAEGLIKLGQQAVVGKY